MKQKKKKNEARNLEIKPNAEALGLFAELEEEIGGN